MFVIGLLGIILTIAKRRQLLAIYLFLLLLLCISQAITSTVCLAIKPENTKDIVKQAWTHTDKQSKEEMQNYFQCCGLFSQNITGADTTCSSVLCCANGRAYCCTGKDDDPRNVCPCDISCWEVINPFVEQVMELRPPRGVCEAHLHPSYKPCVTGAIPSQTYGGCLGMVSLIWN